MGTPYDAGTIALSNSSGSISFTGIEYSSDWNTLNGHMLSAQSSLGQILATLELNTGALGALEPGSLSNSASQLLKVNSDMLKIMSQSMENINKITVAIENISGQLAAMSGTVAQGVATQQISVANQIQKNKFDQNATQAALARNGLPAVEVTPTDLLDTIRTNVISAGEVAASASATGLVTSVSSSAISKATGYITGMLPSNERVKNFFSNILKIRAIDTETTIKKEAADLTATQARGGVAV